MRSPPMKPSTDEQPPLLFGPPPPPENAQQGACPVQGDVENDQMHLSTLVATETLKCWLHTAVEEFVSNVIMAYHPDCIDLNTIKLSFTEEDGYVLSVKLVTPPSTIFGNGDIKP